MRSMYVPSILLALALIVSAQPSTAQSVVDSDWRDFDLLNGRLVISAPGSAEFDTLTAGNIMAADPSEESQSQLRIQAVGTEIVVYTRELYALFPDDPELFFREQVWGGELPDQAGAPGSISVAEPLRAYGVAKGAYPHPSGNRVLASLLVAQADSLAHYVYIMTWDVDGDTLEHVSEIAKQIVLSLRPGPRQELLAGGKRVLTTLHEDGKQLELAVPAGFAFSTQIGPDFTVFNLLKPTRLDGAGSGRLGIYVGHHPSFHFSRQGLQPSDLLQVPTTILGGEAEWLERREASGSGVPDWTHRETMLRLGSGSPPPMLHLFISAPQGSDELAEFTRIAETELRLTPQ